MKSVVLFFISLFLLNTLSHAAYLDSKSKNVESGGFFCTGGSYERLSSIEEAIETYCDSNLPITAFGKAHQGMRFCCTKVSDFAEKTSFNCSSEIFILAGSMSKSIEESCDPQKTIVSFGKASSGMSYCCHGK